MTESPTPLARRSNAELADILDAYVAMTCDGTGSTPENFPDVIEHAKWLREAASPPPTSPSLIDLATALGWGDRMTPQAILEFAIERELLLRLAQEQLETHRSNAGTAAAAIRERIETLRASTPPTDPTLSIQLDPPLFVDGAETFNVAALVSFVLNAVRSRGYSEVRATPPPETPALKNELREALHFWLKKVHLSELSDDELRQFRHDHDTLLREE